MKILTVIALLLASMGPAWAGSFNVSPIRIELSPHKPTQALTLTNEGDEPVVIQVQPLLWTQQNWKDLHTPTDQIIATPPVVRIPAHGRQVVRIGIRRPLAAGTEGAFRLYLTEMPAPAKSGDIGLHVSLRLDLPLFVTTSNDLRPDLRWSVAQDEKGIPHVMVANAGSSHVQLTDLRFLLGEQVLSTPQPANAYVLPGATRRWPLVAMPPHPADLSLLRVRASADTGFVDAAIAAATTSPAPKQPIAAVARD